MKNKESGWHWSVVFFVMTMGLALFSWVGHLYGWEPVQSLLSEEGIRWAMNHVVGDYVQCPALSIVLLMFMGVGIGIRGGLYDAIRRIWGKGMSLSGKERRSLMLSLVVGVGYALVVFFSVPYLKSVTDTLLHSPFQKGFIYILSFGLGLMGLVYGYASNHFLSLGQVIEAMAHLISRKANYFVSLFFIVQFFSALSYTHFPEWMGLNTIFVDIPFHVCCFLPLFFPSKPLQKICISANRKESY